MAALPPELRERLEAVLVEAGLRVGFDLSTGNAKVEIGLENGRVRWVQPTLLRVPVSRLEGETA